MSASRPNNPIIAVMGATGTGKSQLAVDLATRFNGEIINCDAVQMYKGLPIITNKITDEERKGIPHHLLGCIGLEEPPWTVGKFVPEALRISQEIRSRGKLPILVGGTHYYIQSFLVQESLVVREGEVYEELSAINFPILNEPTNVILDKLREVDPVIATRWHPDDRRKISRSLEIWLKSGKRASDVYAEQKRKASEQSQPDGDPETKFDPLTFWVYADKDTLNPRLHQRVLKMVNSGLLDEVKELSEAQSKMEIEKSQVDLTRGIWISIGYKEFADHTIALTKKAPTVELEELKNKAIERTQISTHQYAKSQLKWIRNKLIKALQRAGTSSIYLLDGSDINKWQISVSDRAIEVTRSFLNGTILPDPIQFASPYEGELLPKGQDLSHDREQWQKKTCDTCGVSAITPSDWEKHISSNRHKKTLASKRRRALVATPNTNI
jgi:tRNA dimethylallyltransferase